jgi:hypothetical protein
MILSRRRRGNRPNGLLPPSNGPLRSLHAQRHELAAVPHLYHLERVPSPWDPVAGLFHTACSRPALSAGPPRLTRALTVVVATGENRPNFYVSRGG